MNDVTNLLQRLQAGEDAASGELLVVIYRDLREQAQRQLSREKPGQTLQATALVHEAYLRLLGPSSNDDSSQRNWRSRGHFFAAAAEAMRRILVERARRKMAKKRGENAERVDIELDYLAGKEHDAKLLALDEALRKLEATEPQKAQVVKLRFFAGMTIEQTAQALDIGTSTVDRYWTYARAWLQREMS
ncbi:MAG: sigma-70 family RNA polymerase sigma factor [Planctomycetales bacterium]|nr:sigma-70 family RNA polymerase sigma factor [Planctomycetales bacterium]